MARPILSRAVAVALFLVLALPGAALAAKPVERFHAHYTDSFPEVLCGIAVETQIVVTENIFLYANDSFKTTSSYRLTFTNPVNGKSVLLSSAGTFQGTALIDEQAGTITFVDTYKGLPEKYQTDHGRVLTRDAGIITFSATFDLETDEFLGFDFTMKGPHPEADSDFLLGCEVVTAALT